MLSSSKPPFFMAMSFSAGDAGNSSNLPATLMSYGKISGWTGGAGVNGVRNARTYVDSRVTTTPAFDKDYNIYLGSAIGSGLAVSNTDEVIVPSMNNRVIALNTFSVFPIPISGTALGGPSPAIGYDGIYLGSSAGTINLIGNYIRLKPPIIAANPIFGAFLIHINPGDPAPDTVEQVERRIEGGQRSDRRSSARYQAV